MEKILDQLNVSKIVPDKNPEGVLASASGTYCDCGTFCDCACDCSYCPCSQCK